LTTPRKTAIAFSGESWLNTAFAAAIRCASSIAAPPTQQVKTLRSAVPDTSHIAVATSALAANGDGEQTVSTVSVLLSASTAESAAAQWLGLTSDGSASGLDSDERVCSSSSRCLTVSRERLPSSPPERSSVSPAIRPRPWPLARMVRRSPRRGRTRAIASMASNTSPRVSMRTQPARCRAAS
jgi:hypothetical protein